MNKGEKIVHLYSHSYCHYYFMNFYDLNLELLNLRRNVLSYKYNNTSLTLTSILLLELKIPKLKYNIVLIFVNL